MRACLCAAQGQLHVRLLTIIHLPPHRKRHRANATFAFLTIVRTTIETPAEELVAAVEVRPVEVIPPPQLRSLPDCADGLGDSNSAGSQWDPPRHARRRVGADRLASRLRHRPGTPACLARCWPDCGLHRPSFRLHCPSPRQADLACAVNSSLYAILSSVRNDRQFGLSPGGLTAGYNGHT